MEFYCKTLPNPFLMRDGSTVETRDDWKAQAEWIRELAQTHMYGQWPGKARRVEAACPRDVRAYDEIPEAALETLALTVNGEFSFDVMILRPQARGRVPVIVYNEGGALSLPRTAERIIKAGYALVVFNREQIAPDLRSAEKQNRLDEVKSRSYPKLNCGDIMAWAWGHSVIADYLETRDFAGDLICTGHSRGGKAALCAGVFDERFAVVAPIGSGCGGAGCARFLGAADGSRQDPTRCETIGRMASVFPTWMAERYARYGTREKPFPVGEEVYAFPIDAHMLRAACAPRAVLSSEGEDDAWCNVFGNQLCWQAAQPVFDLFNAPCANGFMVRPGGHDFTEEDWRALIDFCNINLNRPRHIPQNALYKPYFEMDIRQYAPWMRV